MDETRELRVQVELARDGDRRALAWLYDRYRDRVIRFCLSFPPIREADAQDLGQEVFVRAFKGIDRLREARAFEGWLFAIARRRCLSHLSRASRQREDLKRFATDQLAGSEAGSKGQDQLRLEIELVGEEIERQPDSNTTRAGRMFYRQGLDTGRIAEELGVPVSTVTTWLSRFRARIRKRLVARVLRARGHVPGEGS